MAIWTVTDPIEIARRLKDGCCLGCNRGGMNHPSNIDPSTGFARQYCIQCDEHNKLAGPKQSPSAAKFKREHKEEGIKNLDRLIGLD